MGLKLLSGNDGLLKNEEAGVSLKLGRLLPEHIAELQGLRYTSNEPAITMAVFALREIISELTVQKDDYEPRKLSFTLDTADDDNKAICHVISALLIEKLLMDDEALKKLKKLRKTSSKETTEKAA